MRVLAAGDRQAGRINFMYSAEGKSGFTIHKVDQRSYACGPNTE